MDDKEIKQMLKDAGFLLIDASKSWLKYPEIAERRFGAAQYLMEELASLVIVDRPMGGEEGEDA